MKTPDQLRKLFYGSNKKNSVAIVDAIKHLCDLQESYLRINGVTSAPISRQVDDLIEKL